MYASPLPGGFDNNIANTILGCRFPIVTAHVIIFPDQSYAGLVNPGAPVFDAACSAASDEVRAKIKVHLFSPVFCLYLIVRCRMVTPDITNQPVRSAQENVNHGSLCAVKLHTLTFMQHLH